MAYQTRFTRSGLPVPNKSVNRNLTGLLERVTSPRQDTLTRSTHLSNRLWTARQIHD